MEATFNVLVLGSTIVNCLYDLCLGATSDNFRLAFPAVDFLFWQCFVLGLCGGAFSPPELGGATANL